jgi:hypothetical protein
MTTGSDHGTGRGMWVLRKLSVIACIAALFWWSRLMSNHLTTVVAVAVLACACDGVAIAVQPPVLSDAGTSPSDGAVFSVSFSRDVFPIVQQAGCASPVPCHSDTRSPTAHYSDYRTLEDTYVQWTTGTGFDHCSPDGGPSISAPPPEPRLIPGNVDSLLIRKLTEMRDDCAPFYGRMPPPPRARLSPEQIDTIRTWIREGAQKN